jgi:hypothetical protein
VLLQPFADIVHASLPAELRELTYDCLWDDHFTDYVDSQISAECTLNDDVRNSQDWILEAPSFADAKFVGDAFAREAATYFFRWATGAEVHYRCAKAFLNMKHFGGMSFRPRDVIRRLTVNIEYSFTSQNAIDFDFYELHENLDSLLSLPVKDDFAIDIYVSRDMQFSCNLFIVLEILRPIYFDLVHKGHKVRVLGYRFFTPAWRRWSVGNVIYEIPRTRPTCTTAEQLNHYFHMLPEEWLAMKTKEISKMKPPQRMLKCWAVCFFISGYKT